MNAQKFVDDEVVSNLTSLGMRQGRPNYYDYLVNLFTKQWQELHHQLDEATQVHDALTIRSVAHRIKGSAYSLGLRELAVVAGELQQLAEGSPSDWDEIASTGKDIAACYHLTQHYISRIHFEGGEADSVQLQG